MSTRGDFFVKSYEIAAGFLCELRCAGGPAYGMLDFLAIWHIIILM